MYDEIDYQLEEMIYRVNNFAESEGLVDYGSDESESECSACFTTEGTTFDSHSDDLVYRKVVHVQEKPAEIPNIIFVDNSPILQAEKPDYHVKFKRFCLDNIKETRVTCTNKMEVANSNPFERAKIELSKLVSQKSENVSCPGVADVRKRMEKIRNIKTLLTPEESSFRLQDIKTETILKDNSMSIYCDFDTSASDSGMGSSPLHLGSEDHFRFSPDLLTDNIQQQPVNFLSTLTKPSVAFDVSAMKLAYEQGKKPLLKAGKRNTEFYKLLNDIANDSLESHNSDTL